MCLLTVVAVYEHITATPMYANREVDRFKQKLNGVQIPCIRERNVF